MRLMVKLFRVIAARIYRPHIAFEFPFEMLAVRRRALGVLPDSYEVRQPPHPGDEAAVAALLQQDPGFGKWTAERVRDELYNRLVHPLASTLILHNGVPVAAAFATDASTRRKKIAHGMYLYVAPAHRSRSQLGVFLVYGTLGHCVEAGYDQVIAFTDPTRLSALLLYLSSGVLPVYDTLSSYWQWRNVLRRLRPALERAARQRAARGAQAA